MSKKYFFKLTAPCELSCLGLVQSFVRDSARLYGFGADDISRIELAVEEGVANVMKHAFQGDDEPETVDIICERTPLGMRIIIKEKGIPFDPMKLPEFHRAIDMDHVPTSGMGLLLMRESMDEVSFHNLGLDGKETHLVKHLPRKNIKDYLSPDEHGREKAAPADSPPAVEKIAYGVRRMSPDEAIEVSRCAYKTHGYTFFDDLIYFPERIVEMNNADEMISAVAVTDGNDFMGHAALVYSESGSKIAEYTFVFVNQAYRNQGCMKRLCHFLLTVPKKHPLVGVYSYSVANHVFTQRGVMNLGFRDCGILLATSPATWKFKGIAEPDEQRISVVLSFYFIEKPERRSIYAPPHHLEMMGRIYQNIQAPCVFVEPDREEPDFSGRESQLETIVYTVENCATIQVNKYGPDIVHQARAILRDLCLKNVAAIDLLLPLEDPGTWFMTREIEKLGFFFSGVLPGTPVGDVLILQYLNNIDLNYDRIEVYSDMAKELLRYIKAQDPNSDL